MSRILLTGAGFSRNWGGWLANEVFEYVVGRAEVGAELRRRLWHDKWQGNGFEQTLGDLQTQFRNHERLTDGDAIKEFTAALIAMFDEMNLSLCRTKFEFAIDQNDGLLIERSVSNFLSNFDAMFTLNQDVLLERHHVNKAMTLSRNKPFNGSETPGLEPIRTVETGIHPM